MAFTIAISTLVVLYMSTFIYRLIRNVLHARNTNLPVVIIPFDQNHFIWMLTSVPLRPFLRRNLPRLIWDRLALTIYGWEFYERLRPFQHYAAPQGNDKTFFLAGCGRLELWTCDHEVASEILRRPRDFQQDNLTALFMGVFGDNILTTNGDRWARQRKVVASVINERISKVVFEESMRQTRGMIDEILAGSSSKNLVAGNSNKMFDMLKKITIHVLSGAGMGTSVPWRNEDDEKPQPGFRMTYIESTKAVMNSVTGPILLSPAVLTRWPSWLPGYETMKQAGIAKLEFPRHTNRLLNEERTRAGEKIAGRNNIMSQMIRTSEEDPSAEGKALSDEEMVGNLFIFTAAGFETTANTLSYALMLLARYPLWQDWLIEEIEEILPREGGPACEYAAVFPRATRVQAFLFETLRLYTPVVHLTKECSAPQSITTSRGTICLPAHTNVLVNTVAMHLDPEVWRDVNHESDPGSLKNGSLPPNGGGGDGAPPPGDEYAFRPSRWINPPGSQQQQQQLLQPPKGTFIPWSAGPRVCPGQKMAQVEFAAVVLTLLHRHRIDAVHIGEESRVQVEERLDAAISNSMCGMTLQMNGVYNPGENGGVPLRLSSRV